MSVLTIPDNLLEKAGVSQKEALLELACRLFDIGRLSLWGAAQLAGLTRIEMEDALLDRKIPIYRLSVEDLRQELAAMEKQGI